ncbi:MAG: hypothetical protein BWX69_00916 [Planctomycetes bacterium ADurb.Bin069]|nr:MAG: hypothetical protein BWX69_00916 [Planctomycetes bacterium ADurb.Bin069]
MTAAGAGGRREIRGVEAAHAPECAGGRRGVGSGPGLPAICARLERGGRLYRRRKRSFT